MYERSYCFCMPLAIENVKYAFYLGFYCLLLCVLPNGKPPKSGAEMQGGSKQWNFRKKAELRQPTSISSK